ncbi:HTH-type transcriptional regulator/antitoxin HigA [Aquimarina sp. MAR_2010_214]|uniref:XRE family transcriptional regulator n=1 Tax=Aquimarina sp. MAR_2010_214 TaxID=1250026 RepID=UPI000C70FD40|nr:ImmA/IrrE family metallo-endopeptidase [Aquimarina sp. MAR_2010_214]PKV49211.1 HTH-type transcriptional regulator/antitoxin HigA [Aquimarina sp. MAR_2010_214]
MTKTTSDFKSPGQALRHFLALNGWTQEDLAHILSVSLKHTNELIKDKKSISIDIARLLEKVFEWNAYDWVMLDTNFQLSKKVEQKKEQFVERKAEVYKYLPINELIKKGWLKPYKDSKELDKQLQSFWGLSDNNEIDLSFLLNSKSVQLEYRTSESYKGQFKEFNALIWHQKALTHSKKIKAEVFNKKKLEVLMSELHQYTIQTNGVSKFLNELTKSGVKFCFLSHLSKTYLDGAAFLSEINPVIALTGRYDRVDNFWFTIAHEISHVYAHLTNKKAKDTIFIDDTSSAINEISKKEEEANDMAEKMLLKDEIFEYFNNDFGYITDDKVREFSRTHKLHPSIVVGILAFNKKVSYSTLHRFKESIRDKIPNKYRAE